MTDFTSGISRRGLIAGAACVAAAMGTLGWLGMGAGTVRASAAETAATVDNGDGTRTFTDDAGRALVIPSVENLTGIYFTSPISEIFSFTLAPDLGIGTTYENLSDAELELLPQGYGELPYLGSLAGGGEMNYEAIIDAGPQLIINISSSDLTDSDVSTTDEIQNQTGVPVVLLNGAMENVANLYARLGDLLGREDDAKRLSDYCTKVLDDVKAAVGGLSDDQKTTLYYAEGSDGLQTEPESSPHALTFKLAGAKNIADVEANPGKGMSQVSLEQVLAWDPEVIIAWSTEVRGGASDTIVTDENWAQITAVKQGRVYAMPNTPFSWCDRPPSVNRFLGVQWVANLLYPDLYDVDMVEVTKEFYSTFYHVDIDDAKAIELLGNSYSGGDGAVAASASKGADKASGSKAASSGKDAA
ncbi:MAG: ABC transporter substrate-binding protein [Coriobacteriales bacterium]|jgi:iron complex transport system substrate-binding protein